MVSAGVFPSIHIEGGLFASDLLEQLSAGALEGQKPADFGLPPGRNLTNEIGFTLQDVTKLWQVFQSRRSRLAEDDPGTSLTRAAWMVPFFSELGYDLQPNPRAYVIEGQTFAISHRAGTDEGAPPVHIVGFRQELGRVAASGRPRLSPHALLQEYLNRSEALWGIVTNGRTLRLLRDSSFVHRQAYVEFDLEKLFEEQRFADFAVLYRLLHRTRLPAPGTPAESCLLERYYQQSIEQGGRVREHLRDGVQACILALANGFLRHPQSAKLRTWAEREGAEKLYAELLRLVYRLLFLLVSEERGLISDNELYLNDYGVSRLRRLAEQPDAYTEDPDLWLSLCALWEVLRDERFAHCLEVAPLDGDLFAPLELDRASISNRDLLEAFGHLAFYQENGSAPRRRVNYAALDTEELGSVYESLLDYHPALIPGQPPKFELGPGSERKSTGSYYTPPALVSELVSSALEPVIQDHLEKQGRNERAILSIKVVDPACGSGHFLLAAARRLGMELARIRTGEDEPAPEPVRAAVRDVIAHCIYGVDKNPLAVELARVALWLESQARGKPLTFLDHRIRRGDSLIGVLDPQVLKAGLPDAAFEPLSGDDKGVATGAKRLNRQPRGGQMPLPLKAEEAPLDLKKLAVPIDALDAIRDDSLAQIEQKRRRYHDFQASPERQHVEDACDLWTAAFFQSFSAPPGTGGDGGQRLITTDTVWQALAGRPEWRQALGRAQDLANEIGFFHWSLEFPEVFARGGFDVVLANPPWERIKLQEQEFFAARDARIALAPNAAARQRLIEALPRENPALWQAYHRALHTAESTSRFLRGCGQYPLAGRGDINTYSVFAERMAHLPAPSGRAGIIVPSGIATDDTNKEFFGWLVEGGRLASLYDFENRAKLFPAVDSRMKFCLLTLRGGPPPDGENSAMGLAFFCTRAEHLHDERRRFSLTPQDIARINPNTRTLPVFRTRQDAELTRAIYARVPVLIREADVPADSKGEPSRGNPWGICFLAMFHMSNDSRLFRTAKELEDQGYVLRGNRLLKEVPVARESERRAPAPSLLAQADPPGGETRPDGSGREVISRAAERQGLEVYLPLYEAKMIWHYDHRFGSYAGVTDRASTHLPTPTEAEHADPAFLPQPWYWVNAREVDARLKGWPRGWLLGFRNVTNMTNERTAVFALIPRTGVGNSLPTIFPGHDRPSESAALLGNLTALPFDWVVRQKVAGMNMNFFYVEQFPVLPPSVYGPAELAFIVPRVLELAYTAWDVKPFADDVWQDAPVALRQAIRDQGEANAAETGGHGWELPGWIEACPEIETDPAKGIPLPPFKWQEARRARLRAELDAYYARLYGLTRKQLRYVLDPADLTPGELEDILDPHEEVQDALDPAAYAERCAQSDFPGETFRVLKEKELREHGEYRTRRLVLQAWEKLLK